MATDWNTSDHMLHELLTQLTWQQKLGHPGIPVAMIKERLEKEKQDAPVRPKPASAGRKPLPMAARSEKNVTKPAKKQTPSASPATGKILTLDEIQTELGDCTRCKLHPTRNKIVFGEGDPNADIMFIGEGPGADEDEQGRPFVGRAGKLLTRWIELGMGIERKDVFIANIVKCRPPNNRNPEKDEVEACIGFIHQQIEAIQPKVIVLLGNVPKQHLLGTREGITKVHGKWHRLNGIPAMPIFHPSYCLRPPQDEKRRIIWDDLKKILKFLNMPIPGKKK